jgi:hypothetical protein
MTGAEKIVAERYCADLDGSIGPAPGQTAVSGTTNRVPALVNRKTCI